MNTRIKLSSLISLALIIVILSSCSPRRQNYKQGVFSSASRRGVVRSARRYLGVKYRYGGTDPSGFDCSGYTNYVYKRNGLSIPRTAGGQFAAGRRIGIRRAKPGDLVFFKINRRKISHVGIYMGNYTFIHSPRTGRTVSVDNIRKDYWRKRYAGTVTFFR